MSLQATRKNAGIYPLTKAITSIVYTTVFIPSSVLSMNLVSAPKGTTYKEQRRRDQNATEPHESFGFGWTCVFLRVEAH